MIYLISIGVNFLKKIDLINSLKKLYTTIIYHSKMALEFRPVAGHSDAIASVFNKYAQEIVEEKLQKQLSMWKNEVPKYTINVYSFEILGGYILISKKDSRYGILVGESHSIYNNSKYEAIKYDTFEKKRCKKSYGSGRHTFDVDITNYFWDEKSTVEYLDSL